MRPLLLASGLFSALAAPPKVILMVIADDYGWWNIDMDDHNVAARTPNLHRLSKSGVRLDRHYVYKYCSPTRASLMTGRLPIHVNQNNEGNSLLSTSGADIRMTTLPQKLKQANPPFQTHLFGKWHCGARSAANLPINRGYDSHLGFLKGMEDHFTQRSAFNGYANKYVDLWHDHGPADNSLNGTFSVFRDTHHAISALDKWDPHSSGQSLYLDVRFGVTHEPYEVPSQYRDPRIKNQCAQTYAAMASVMDEGIGNLTSAIQARGLWDDTLLIFSADNGAPTRGGSCGNNYPLRGGKTSDFEGGVRASAFVGGGYVPPGVRGKVHTGLMHIADWFATLSTLVGVDPVDDSQWIRNGPLGSGIPGIDGVDQWSSITSSNASASARDEIALAFCTNVGGAADGCVSSVKGVMNTSRYDQGAFIADGGRWKVVFGNQHGFGFFTGPLHPNGTKNYEDAGCPSGCLFNLFDDPTEHTDVKEKHLDVFSRLKSRLEEIGKTVFQTRYTDVPQSGQCLSESDAAAKYNGHLGPQCVTDESSAATVRFV